MTTQTKADDVGTPTPTKGGEEQILEEKEKKKVTSFLPKFASPTNDLFWTVELMAVVRNSKEAPNLPSGPKAVSNAVAKVEKQQTPI